MLKLSLEGQIAELEATFKAAHQVYLQDTQEPSQVPPALLRLLRSSFANPQSCTTVRRCLSLNLHQGQSIALNPCRAVHPCKHAHGKGLTLGVG